MTKNKVYTYDQAQKLGEELEIDWSKFDVEQFRMGLDVELEHGTVNPQTNVSQDDPSTTAKITLAHLKEFPDYYTRLQEMELEAKKYWENR